MATAFPQPATRKPKGSGPKKVALAIGGVLVLAGAAYGVGYALVGNAVPQNTTVGGVAVGGMSVMDAEAALASHLASAENAPVTLKTTAATVTKTPTELGVAVDVPASIAQIGVRKTLNPAAMVAALTGGASLPLVVTTDASKLDVVLASVAESDTQPVDAKLTFSGLTPKVGPAKDGVSLDGPAAKQAIVAAWPASATIDLPVITTPAEVTTAEAQGVLDTVATPAVSGPVTLKAGEKTAKLQPADIAKALKFTSSGGTLVGALDAKVLDSRLADRLKSLGVKAPKNATIRLSGGKPKVIASVDGFGVTPESVATAVMPLLATSGDREATVELSKVKADLDTADAKKLGVKQVVGEFKTVFPGTYAYRYVNIPKAAKMLNNMLIMPGETFSMNDALGGERTAAKGWAAGFGISNGKETLQLGGALSQVTTTMYNAVFFGGFEDIYHKPHSLYFSRYPKGREATISYPAPDMKFRNDSKYAVLIQASTTGRVGTSGTITIKLWSTKRYTIKQANTTTSNYTSAASSPVEDNSPNCIAQPAINGFDVRFDRQFWAGGKLVKSQKYFWRYNTLHPTVCTNTAAKAP